MMQYLRSYKTRGTSTSTCKQRKEGLGGGEMRCEHGDARWRDRDRVRSEEWRHRIDSGHYYDGVVLRRSVIEK